MEQTIFTLITYFGGVVLYLLTLSIFSFGVSRAFKLFFFFIACVPVLGVVVYSVLIAVCFITYQKDRFYGKEFIQVKDNKLNRMLFNDINWKEYDEYRPTDKNN